VYFFGPKEGGERHRPILSLELTNPAVEVLGELEGASKLALFFLATVFAEVRDEQLCI
jgi:hypothetical protein